MSNVGKVRAVRGSSFTVLAENAGDALVMRLGKYPEFIIASGFNPNRFDWDSGKYFGQDLEKAMYEWYIEEGVENFENIRKHKVDEEVLNELVGIFFNEDGEEAEEGEESVDEKDLPKELTPEETDKLVKELEKALDKVEDEKLGNKIEALIKALNDGKETGTDVDTVKESVDILSL